MSRFCDRSAAAAARGVIWLYQGLLSPLIGTQCRFSPTCSEFARENYGRFSFIAATVRSAKRIFSCHPFHSGGYDPVEGERGAPR